MEKPDTFSPPPNLTRFHEESEDDYAYRLRAMIYDMKNNRDDWVDWANSRNASSRFYQISLLVAGLVCVWSVLVTW